MPITPIATSTLNSAGHFSFSSIPATYKHLYVTIAGSMSATGLRVAFRFNSDTGNNYYLLQNWEFTSTGAWGRTKESAISSYYLSYSSTNVYSSQTYIFDYADTSKNKQLLVKTAQWADYTENYGGGGWGSTSAINAISTIGDTTFASGTTMTIYGVA